MKHKKIIISVLAVALLATVAYGSTLAWLSDKDEVKNTISFGEVKTEIFEEYKEGEGTFKRSYIKNMSEVSPCLVRARVTISPAEVASDIVLTDKGENWAWNGWSNGEYVYYEEVLEANTATTYLFEGIDKSKLTDEVVNEWIAKGITTFDITVYEESVQAVVYKNGEKISAIKEDGVTYDPIAAEEIWALYDSNLLEALEE